MAEHIHINMYVLYIYPHIRLYIRTFRICVFACIYVFKLIIMIYISLFVCGACIMSCALHCTQPFSRIMSYLRSSMDWIYKQHICMPLHQFIRADKIVYAMNLEII